MSFLGGDKMHSFEDYQTKLRASNYLLFLILLATTSEQLVAIPIVNLSSTNKMPAVSVLFHHKLM